MSPFDPHISFTYAALCLAFYTSGAYAEASEWGRRAMSTNPGFTATLRLLAATLAAAGEADEARTVGRQLLQVEPSFNVQSFCDAYAYRGPEHRREMARHLRAAGLPG